MVDFSDLIERQAAVITMLQDAILKSGVSGQTKDLAVSLGVAVDKLEGLQIVNTVAKREAAHD